MPWLRLPATMNCENCGTAIHGAPLPKRKVTTEKPVLVPIRCPRCGWRGRTPVEPSAFRPVPKQQALRPVRKSKPKPALKRS